jgi:rhamnulokinase
LGNLLPRVAETAGVERAPVYATAAHDTAAAVAAVPASGTDWCYISSGTWSLMGVEIDEPLVGETSLGLNFTNEIGVEGKVRLLKNIAGLWVLQECRRAWARAGREYSYEQLVQLASEARPFAAVIDPDGFLEPGRMPERIAEFCRNTGQAEPEQPGAMCRVALESLALRYRQVVENLETLTGRTIRVIHIVGGGSKNRLLNQLAADATGRRVVAGPVEATAAGNVLVQAIGAGELRGLKEVRDVVRDSFELETFEPSGADWSGAWRTYLDIMSAAAR